MRNTCVGLACAAACWLGTFGCGASRLVPVDDAATDGGDSPDGYIGAVTKKVTVPGDGAGDEARFEGAADAESEGAAVRGCTAGVDCAGQCVSTTSDPNNCGACGRACLRNELCSQGMCGSSCTQGTSNCSGTCVDTASDRANCGSCGHSCVSGEVCLGGSCACVGRSPAICAGTCVDLASDPNNCGLCGNDCFVWIDAGLPNSSNGSTESCSNGLCVAYCAAGLVNCSRACVNLQSDNANCGACGTVCPNDTRCIYGACRCVNDADTVCDGLCTDTRTDSANCGGCGQACPPSAPCASGACAIVCPSGQTQCGPICIDLMTTKEHCGLCDQVCGGDLICSRGQCACPNGLVACDGHCVNLASDAQNCGACQSGCGTGAQCVMGACR